MTADIYSMFDTEMKSAFSAASHGDALKHFYRAMKMKAETIGRDLAENNPALLQAQSGEMRILYELADWAGAALEALKSEAKGQGAEGIPQFLT